MVTETIGGHKLYFGNCEDFVEQIGPVDVLCTDPPYLFSTSGGGAYRAARPMLDEIADDDLDKGFDLKIINPLLYRSAVVFCHNDQLHEIAPHMAGSYWRSVLCVWEKENPQPHANRNYAANTEFYFHAWQEGAYPLGTFHEKMRTIRTIITKRKYKHPTVKPDAVMDKIMKNVNGETVIDPFMGTGSTGVSAIKHGKRFIGIENKQEFFDIACARIEEAVKIYGQK